jgi:hypothetical protein
LPQEKQMPGPFTHVYAAQRIADFMASEQNFVRPEEGPLGQGQLIGSPASAQQFADIMKKWPKFTNLGAIGPDLFFFCLDFHQDFIFCDELMLALRSVYTVDDSKRADWEPFLAILDKFSQPWAAFLRFLIKLDKIWQKFLQAWNDTIGKVTNAVGQIVDDLTGGMLSALGDAMTQFADSLVALIVQELISGVDVFGYFSLVMQEGVDEKSFVWSDMLHYRNTSLFARKLFEQATTQPDKDQRDQFLAYALGYMCHMGVDTVSHAFVNEQSGGPYRTHWTRHHLIENHIDAWNYHQTNPGGTLPHDPICAATPAFSSLAQSALYFAVQLSPAEPNGKQRPAVLPPEGKTPEEKRARKEALDADGELPLWLAEGIVKALIDTYKDEVHPINLKGDEFQRTVVDNVMVDGQKLWNDPPLGFAVPVGFPLPWEVQVTYRFMLTFFKRVFMDGFDLPKPPRPTVAPFPTFPTGDLAPDFSGVNSSDPPAKQLLDILLALLFWLVRLLKDGAQWAYDAVKSILSGGTLPLREEIYQHITLPSWQVVRGVREILVHLGILTPQDREVGPDGEELHPSEIDEQLIKLGHTVDGAFLQALADATDPLGNLDRNTGLIHDHDPQSVDYPWLPIRDQNNDFAEFHRPWAFPDKNNDASANHVEQYRTVPGPFAAEMLPDALLSPMNGGSNSARQLYEKAATTHDTDCLNEALVRPTIETADRPTGGPLGDATVFSAYLIGRITGDAKYPADFNLDSDRGYGYLCWDWNRKGEPLHSSYRGAQFPEPCVWPEASHGSGADSPALNQDRKWAGDGSVLQLHYKRTGNPGCIENYPSPDDCGENR